MISSAIYLPSSNWHQAYPYTVHNCDCTIITRNHPTSGTPISGTSLPFVLLMVQKWLTFALVRVPRGGPLPRGVVVKRQTLVAVRPRSVVLAFAHSPPGAVDSRRSDAFGSVTVALAPCPHGHVGDGVEIGAQHLLIAEHFITEGVEPVQRYHNVGGCHPFLKNGTFSLSNPFQPLSPKRRSITTEISDNSF